ncbi:hypothetical protein FD755_010677 [Muntiacus reevesi]|uniref:Ubiquitin-like protease family profile domain-containing protein n=1 Tax=Muntiacus reevesi TaxID=9886 RepID=A0A5N3XYT8_MUNRE|nr:hypothetical protein FD755_010677 [Muntiacus reevesi]
MDSRLWRLDISLLDSASWLKVHVIGLAFEYFANITQFIKCMGSPAEIAMFLEPLDLPNKRVIFLAINDNSNQTAGGTHWSFLVYLRDKNGSRETRDFLRQKRKLAFVEEKAPAQQYRYDYGMYIKCNT